jgi:hypothetical protein
MFLRHLYLVTLGLVLMTTGCHRWCCHGGCGCCEPCCSSSCYSCGDGAPAVAGDLGHGPHGPIGAAPLPAEGIPAPNGAALMPH